MSAVQPQEPIRRRLAIGLGLFALAAAVRLYRLDQGLWYDEVVAVTHFFRSPWLTLLTRMPDPNHHPLYSLLGKLAIIVLGESEWTVRLPALLAGAASVPSLYFLAARRVSRTAGWVAALAMTFSLWHVWLSQDARGYSLMALCAIWSNYFFLETREDRRAGPAAAYVLFTAAAVYSQAYAIMVPASQLLVGTFDLRARRRRPLLLTLAALVLIGILYAPFAPDALHFARTEGQNTPGREMTPGFLLALVSGWAAGEGQWLLGLPFFALAAAGFAVELRRRPALAAILVLPVALGMAFALLTRTFVYQRFFFFGLAGFLLFIGSGCDWLGRKVRRPRAVTALVLALLIALSLPGLYQYYRLGKQGLRASARWIKGHAPDAPVYTVGLADVVYSYYCPRARSFRKSGLPFEQLRGSIVAVVHPWSARMSMLQALTDFCGNPITFPAAVYQDNVILLFDCREPQSPGLPAP